MIFEFYPWKMDIDVQATSKLYEENDYARGRAANEKLFREMSEKKKEFFSSLGVDFLKVDAEEKLHDIPPEPHDIPSDGEESGGKIYMLKIDFLLRGRFIQIPDYQESIFCDKEITGMYLPDTVKVVKMAEEGMLAACDIDGWACVFKHPFFRSEEEKFKTWDCGYILGSILKMEDRS